MKTHGLIILLSICSFAAFSQQPANDNSVTQNAPVFGMVQDAEGNQYKTVELAGNEWMAENLRSSVFCNGDSILFVPRGGMNSFRSRPEEQPWGDLGVAAWAYYGGSTRARDIHESRAEINRYYGKLYNWFAASDARNICPCGWRVPTESEWRGLINLFGGSRETFNAVKSNHDGFWKYPDSVETGWSGFEALAGGYRNLDGTYSHFGEMGSWWSQDEGTSDRSTGARASIWFIPEYDNRSFQIGYGSKTLGHSVRCIKDESGAQKATNKAANFRERYEIRNGGGATDAAGNRYQTLIIDKLEWFVQNLRTRVYSNGEPIPDLADAEDWRDATSGALSSYENNSSHDEEYGLFYNAFAVEDERGVCPAGWRVPSSRDWVLMLRAVGGQNTAGEVLLDPDVGFVPVFAGFRNLWSGTIGQGRASRYWTSTPHSSDDSYYFYYSIAPQGAITTVSTQKTSGNSIRCVRDVD